MKYLASAIAAAGKGLPGLDDAMNYRAASRVPTGSASVKVARSTARARLRRDRAQPRTTRQNQTQIWPGGRAATNWAITDLMSPVSSVGGVNERN